MRLRTVRWIAGTVTVSSMCSVILVSAQRRTIPEILVDSGRSVEMLSTVPSGTPPTLEAVLKRADTVVRGTVGGFRTRLSEDQRDVLTEYQILKPSVLYQRTMVMAKTPGAPADIVLTIPGGQVEINGLTFTLVDEAAPNLKAGTECLLILRRTGDRYRLASGYYGAFEITGVRIRSLARKAGFGDEILGMSAAQATSRVVDQIRSLNP